MRTTRQNSLPAPSVRTSSSHRSTIETRGVPEFDRDYARQLSVAKRGRSGSVRPSPRAGSAHESPLEEANIGHFQGSAAAAATRIKDYVATHVTPPRPFHSGTPSRPTPDHPGSARHAAASSAVKSSPPPSQTGNGHGGAASAAAASSSSKPFLVGAATPSANDDGVGGSESPPGVDSLNSTRRGSVDPPHDDATSDATGESVAAVVVKTVVVSAAVFFLLLCALSFVVSSDKDYNAAYFSVWGGAGATTQQQQQRVARAVPRSFPERVIPEVNRQVALHTRRLLRQLVHSLGVMKALRFVGRMLRSTTRPFTFFWVTLKEGFISPITMVFPEMDLSLHPTLRYIFASSTEGAEGSTVSKSGAVFGSIARSLMQLIVEPVYIVGRTLHALGSGLSQSIQLFSVPLVGHNVSSDSTAVRSSSGNVTAPARAFNRTARTSTMSRAAASMALGMWRPLYRLWSVVLPLTDDGGNHSSSLRSNHATSHASRNLSNAVIDSSASTSPTAAPAEKKEETAAGEKPDTTLRTTHSRRLGGELWAVLLEKDREALLRLAREDLQEMFGADAKVENVQLRRGSLVVDFAVVARGAAAAATTEEGNGVVEQLRATQKQRDGQVKQGRFPRLQAYYDDAAAAVKREKEEASKAATECDARVSACEQDCDARHQALREEAEACREASAEAQLSCEAAQRTVAEKSEAALQACRSTEAACRADVADCATKLAETERLLAVRDAEMNETAAALTATKRALSAASVGCANESEAERQRCALRVAEVSENCSNTFESSRATLAAEHAADLETRTKKVVAEMQQSEEERCAGRLAEQERDLSEQQATALREAEAACVERLTRNARDINHTTQAAMRELRQTLNSSASDAARRLATCEESTKQAVAQWQTERAEAEAACATKLTAAQHSCEETERQAGKEGCAKRVAALETELYASCNATVQQAEARFQERLTHDMSAVNNSAAAALTQLRETVSATKRDAEARVAACAKLRETERETCAATQRQLKESCTVQLARAQESCTHTMAKELEAERAAQQRIAADNWTRQADALTTRCHGDTRQAVADAAAALELQHAAALEAAAAAAKRQAEENLQAARAAADKERETIKQHHIKELQSCEGRVTQCIASAEATQAAQAKAAADAQAQLIAFLAESGETACLRMTRNDRAGCAAQRKKIAAVMQDLPAGATLLDVLTRLHAGSGSGVSASHGQLTWNFTGSGLSSLLPEPGHTTRGSASWLHTAGMVAGLASAAYAFFRRQQDRRLYGDTMAQLNALIEANETTRTTRFPLPPRPRRGRLGSAADAFADEAPVSWAVAASSLERCTDALASWHATCCELYYEQAAAATVRAAAHGSVLDGVSMNTSDVTQLRNASALSQSRGGVSTSAVSASTLPLSETNACGAESSRALTHMHDAFVSTYFSILEMYYVDLLNAVANRELAESQLQDTEALAARQAAILHKQSAAVAQLKKALAEKEKEVGQQGKAAASGSAGDRLAREERKTAAQQAMIALLEGQLKVSKEELDRARGVVQTPARTPRSEAGAGSSTAKQVRSLQELADVEHDSTNSSDFSNAGRRPSPSHTHAASATSLSDAARHHNPTSLVARGAPSDLARAAIPASAMKKPTSMVRDPESTRRFQKLRWNDEASPQ